ncbi:hypothetical protein UD06_03375 [Campylobacter coli]|nr:hypothetical protein [Campylobacter coli]EAH7354919.1 hypothetical protein [Campylobacter coli]EAL6970602.1 hypothetical protein [Campylobacter coli]KQH26208.1 hypothetical protein UD06_03375 [Campylobacter coli]
MAFIKHDLRILEYNEYALRVYWFSEGSDFELMPFLGIQIVSGQNYAFICRRKSVTSHPISAYSLVICYKDLGEIVKSPKLKML